MTFFLDTNICIYFLKGLYPALVTHLEQKRPDQIKIPSMAAAELRFGAIKSARKQENSRLVAAFLEPYEIVPFDDDAAAAYAEVRMDCEKRGLSLGPNDLVIAATVLSGNGTLITRNTREFSAVKGLPLQDWTS